MKNILEIYDIAVKEITEPSILFMNMDMGRLTGVRELYSEEDCLWDMIKETILCSAYKKADREAWFRKFEDLYTERVDSEIKNLSYEF